MRFSYVLGFAVFVIAAPALATSDTAHANIMRVMPSNHVITSNTLYDHFKANSGANHTIYVSDTRKFISLADVKPKQGLSKRQGEENICFGYTHHWAEQIQSWWNPWVPVSGCQFTGLDPAGSSYSINWQYSLSISEDAQ
jgi:hypothetical protein